MDGVIDLAKVGVAGSNPVVRAKITFRLGLAHPVPTQPFGSGGDEVAYAGGVSMLEPGRLRDLEAQLARLMGEGEQLNELVRAASALFIDLPWVGPAADQFSDSFRSMFEHVAAFTKQADALREMLDRFADQFEASEATITFGLATDILSDAPRPIVRSQGGFVIGTPPSGEPSAASPSSEVNVSIYLSTDDEDALRRTRDVVERLLDAQGFEPPEWEAVERGSLRQGGRSKRRKGAVKDEVVERLEKVERAVQVQALDLPQSQANQANAAAVAELSKAHADVPSVVVQLGSLIYVKWTSPEGVPMIMARTLTVRELVAFEKAPNLRADARAAIQFLQSDLMADPELPTAGQGAVPVPDDNA